MCIPCCKTFPTSVRPRYQGQCHLSSQGEISYVTDRHDMTLAVKVALNPNTTNQPTNYQGWRFKKRISVCVIYYLIACNKKPHLAPTLMWKFHTTGIICKVVFVLNDTLNLSEDWSELTAGTVFQKVEFCLCYWMKSNEHWVKVVKSTS